MRVLLGVWVCCVAALTAACGGGGSATSESPPGRFSVELGPATNGAVDLSWSAAAGAASYSVAVGRTSGAATEVMPDLNGTSARVTGLNNGFEVQLKVTARNASGQRDADAPVRALPMYTPTVSYRCLRDFFVSTSGSDSNNGSSEGQAYATLKAAARRADLRAGDCINVLPGTYRQTVTLERGGTSASETGYVVLRSTVPQAARIVGPAGTYSAINLGANYLIVDGFDVTGAEGAGIDGCLDSANGKHHLVVINNRARDSGGSGISLCWGEYFHIEGNVTHGNAATNGYQTSGISIYQARAVSGIDQPGFRNVVRNNVSYSNLITFACDQCHTDGNGIIIDDFQNGQEDSAPWRNVNYPHATLLENNLVFNNGGKGIQVYVSDNVTVRHNTAYFNNTDRNFDGTWRAEMSNSFGADNTWLNNIAVTDSGIDGNNFAYQNTAGSGYNNPGVSWRHNLAFDAGPGNNLVRVDNASGTLKAENGNLLGVDPRFKTASIDPSRADFRLAPGSRALSAGTPTASLDNLNGETRVSGAAPNLGAY